MIHSDSEPRTFAEAIGELVLLLDQSAVGRLPWTRVEVVEVDLSRAKGPVLDGPAVPAETFERRWSDILRRVDRDWVNVSACGVRADALVLAVEWFPAVPGSQRRQPSGQVTLMFSGHDGPYRWSWG